MKSTRVRIAVLASWPLFFAALYLFTGPEADWWRKAGLTTQISPAVGHAANFILVAVFLACALLAGRIYCSILCPAGLIQELFHRIGRRLGTSRLGFRPAPFAESMLILAVPPLLLLFWNLAEPADLLDPVGLFGRLAQPLAQAVAGPGWPAGPSVLLPLLALSLLSLAIIPLFLGRWFCDRLCPVGQLLRLAAAEPTGKRLAIAAENCVSCGRCEKICPARCIDSGGKRLDSSRCVLCLDCLDACGFSALAYGRPAGGEDRRSALSRLAALAAGGVFLAARPLGAAFSSRSGGEGIVPPGSLSPARHRRLCITCQACVPACPVRIIGPGAAGRPVLDFDRGFCQYDCFACQPSCPAGVLVPLGLDRKRRTRIGRTILLLERCVVVTRGTACGACAEVCPTHAVIMVPGEGEALPGRPDFAPGPCIGCGACYHVCPASPRAFRIETPSRHETAGEPRNVGETRPSGEEAAPPLDEFPF
ncbi:MAG: 4Fe-4S dicluster domain-containing protein [Planctomycetota bacterium]|jgi:polyferredoxin|nr:4Fe-4S dicluster domain-containing protein [Planctomycetota bacterium]